MILPMAHTISYRYIIRFNLAVPGIRTYTEDEECQCPWYDVWCAFNSCTDTITNTDFAAHWYSGTYREYLFAN